MTYDWACSIWLGWPVFVYSTFWYITYRQTTQNRNKYRSNEKQKTEHMKNNIGRNCLFSTMYSGDTAVVENWGNSVPVSVHFLWPSSLQSKIDKDMPKTTCQWFPTAGYCTQCIAVFAAVNEQAAWLYTYTEFIITLCVSPKTDS